MGQENARGVSTVQLIDSKCWYISEQQEKELTLQFGPIYLEVYFEEKEKMPVDKKEKIKNGNDVDIYSDAFLVVLPFDKEVLLKSAKKTLADFYHDSLDTKQLIIAPYVEGMMHTRLLNRECERIKVFDT